jgi:ABC-type sugar transport system ATPase subunit
VKNGAGKSTLMKILQGNSSGSGEILLEKIYPNSSPYHAQHWVLA